MTTKSVGFFEVRQGERKFLLTKLSAGTVTKISYAAVRGQSKEEGAIQRVLSRSRIGSIKDFTLQGGAYPNAIVLNWVSKENPITRNDAKISFVDIADSAQIIDGQHRVAGIKAAIEERSDISKLEIPVVIYENLTTRECADLFLAINTEQKPVPRSLVFDLYGVASQELVDLAAVRARDIATYLDEESRSPYYGEIKFPGHKTRKGGIALSTAVSAIKPLVEEKGAFEQLEIHELEVQKQIILNFFTALSKKYQSDWNDKTNAFMYASGFVGAMEFLRLKLMSYCAHQKSFEVETILKAFDFNDVGLMLQSEVKGLGGTAASKEVYDRLINAFKPSKESSVKFKI
jgi:DNA sulfur modification protein DndB